MDVHSDYCLWPKCGTERAFSYQSLLTQHPLASAASFWCGAAYVAEPVIQSDGEPLILNRSFAVARSYNQIVDCLYPTRRFNPEDYGRQAVSLLRHRERLSQPSCPRRSQSKQPERRPLIASS